MSAQPRHEDSGERSGIAATLTATGVTLLGVILSIGLTIGFGLPGPAGRRTAVAFGSVVLLVVVIKVATRTGRGPLARAANWMVSAPPPQ